MFIEVNLNNCKTFGTQFARPLDLQDNEVQLRNKLEHLSYKLVFVDICKTKCAKCVKSNLCHQTEILPQILRFYFIVFRDNMSIQFHTAV